MSDQDWKNKGPWVAIDPSSKREWLLPQPLRYYVVEERETRQWFVCDRWADLPVPDTESKARATTIRRFYKWCQREIPDDEVIPPPMKGVAHHGETG